MIDEDKIRQIVEAALMAADEPLSVRTLTNLFGKNELDENDASTQVRAALKALQEENEQRGVELVKVASGYRYQVRQTLAEWVGRQWDEKPPRYTRALLETLALIAYKQPVTRGDIEQVRGVSVSQNIMRTLLERDWIRVVGQKEVPGRPSLYGTTKAFLDYFNLASLSQLPPLAEIKALIEPVAAEAAEAVEAQEQAEGTAEEHQDGSHLDGLGPDAEALDAAEAEDDAGDAAAGEVEAVVAEVDLEEVDLEEADAQTSGAVEDAAAEDAEIEVKEGAEVVQLPTSPSGG